jgi:general secretion pathway protein J
LNKREGFTLIEMVIAITLLGITMALAYAALAVANQTTTRVAKVQSEVEALRTTYFFLKRHLSQASNQGVSGGNFFGSTDQLSFYAAVPMRAMGGAKPYRFTLYQQAKNDSLNQLMLSYAPVSEEMIEAQRSQVLAEYSGKLEFSYFSGNADDSDAQWLDNWSGAGLPQLVKLKPAEDASLSWPEQVIQMQYAGGQP